MVGKNQLRKDDNAVSPVIGVILMVAITVILAAVIGTFVMGLGQDSLSQQASASVSVAGNDDVTLSSLGSGTDGIYCSGISGDISDGNADEGDDWTKDVGTSIDCSNTDSTSHSVVAFSEDDGMENATVYTFD